jgi:CheY-like chemotaxis protein
LERYRRLTILVAEDSADDIEIAKRAFKRFQFVGDLQHARDGQHVWELLQSLRGEMNLPDLMLLDINMPRLNGFEVLGKIRADPGLRTMPIVMMSASAREEDVLQAYELGANSYVEKPAVFESFVESLELLARYWCEVVRLPRQQGGARDER